MKQLKSNRNALLRVFAVTIALLTIAVISVPALAQGGIKKMQTKPNIVLVHGAWADASGWADVIERLQGAGYTVYAPPNPLKSDRS